MKRLTPFIISLIFIGISVGFFGFAQLQENNEVEGVDDVIKIGVVTWGGYTGEQYFNRGFSANKNSQFYKPTFLTPLIKYSLF